MILGRVCTRGCLFCAVGKGRCPEPLNKSEADNIALAAKAMRLSYVVVTSVCRDDLKDFGAEQFVRVSKRIKAINPQVKTEFLIPDFGGDRRLLKKVISSKIDCLAHNLETVPRIYPRIGRRKSLYKRSLKVIGMAKEINPRLLVKSGLMLGLGEEKKDVLSTLNELRGSDCDVVVIGQYLAPSTNHYPVQRFLSLEEFKEYENISRGLGFQRVLSAPLARSSYLSS